MKKILTVCLALLAGSSVVAEEGPPPDSDKHANMMGLQHFPQQDGESLYKGVCAACHMPDAKGGTGAGYYPALAGNQKLETSAYPVMLVMNGSKAMPSFKHAMSDTQIAAVVTYVRTHFGNSYTDPVTADEVKEVREAGK
ncbi:MAG TPA: c-type cytochrome [Magnetospirillaceae bacterium]|nr:c-type cytochrome [Magnetospirillaceae bacterium]